MDKVSEEDINAISQTTALFNQIGDINYTEHADAETNLEKNHRDNGTFPPISTQLYFPQSLLIDASVSPGEPHPRPVLIPETIPN